VNINNINIGQLGIHPTLTSGFNLNWKTGKITIRLEPGQTYRWTMNGPSNIKYDMNNIEVSDASDFADYRKNVTRCMFMSYYPDTLPSIAGNLTGHFADAATVDEHALTLEQTYYANLSMPENVFGTIPALTETGSTTVAKLIQAGSRRKAYYVKNWPDHDILSTTARGDRIDEEQPATDIP